MSESQLLGGRGQGMFPIVKIILELEEICEIIYLVQSFSIFFFHLFLTSSVRNVLYIRTI